MPEWIVDDAGGRRVEYHPQRIDRAYIGVLFECCGVYLRVYRRRDTRAYTGRCPRCLRQVRVRVGPGGTKERIFRAS